jgi:hypothetical protein
MQFGTSGHHLVGHVLQLATEVGALAWMPLPEHLQHGHGLRQRLHGSNSPQR